MMMAVVRSGGDERALVRTLASLVRGMVEGPLTEVLIAAQSGDSAAIRTAEASGAGRVEAGTWAEALDRCIARAQERRMVLIEAGVVLGEAFWPVLEETLAAGREGPFVTRRDATPVLDHLAFRLAGRIRPDQAVIALPGELAGDPWRGGLRRRARLLRATAFRAGA